MVKTIKMYTGEELKIEADKMGATAFDMKISGGANRIITEYPDFPLDQFLTWWKNQRGIITTHDILMFMEGRN